MFKMIPFFGCQVYFWVDKLPVWPSVYAHFGIHKNLNLFAFFGIFFFKALRKLPYQVRF